MSAPVTPTAELPAGPAAAAAVVFAPFVLGRVGGLPVDACDLVGPATARLLDELAAARGRPARLGTALVEHCFALVPQLDDDPATRRVVLALKRAAHRGTAPAATDEQLAAVAGRLPPAGRTVLADYRRAVADRAAALDRLGAAVAADGDAARRVLAAPLQRPEFAAGVAVAAPEWFRHGVPRLAAGRADQRNLRTLYLYVTRAATKTSPFSTLTTVGLAGAAPTGRACSHAATAVAYAALHAAARDPGAAAALRYRPATWIAPQPGAPDGIVLRGRAGIAVSAWRADEPAHATPRPPWPAAPDLDLAEVLAAVGGRQPWLRFQRLLDAGDVVPVPPWRSGEDPLAAVLAALDRAHPEGVLTGEVRAVRRAAGAVAGAAAGDRVAEIERVREGFGRWRAAGRQRLDTAELVFEDVATDLPVPDPLTDLVRAELAAAVAAEVRPLVYRTHVYDLLLDAFVARFGPGGRCPDPLGFLAGLTVESRLDEALAGAALRDMAPAPERSRLPVGRSSPPVSASLLVQVAADRVEDLGTGRFLLVVNQVNSGLGGMAARFDEVLGGALGPHLREWLEQMWPAERRREVVLSTDCSTSQLRSAGLLPPLGWPGEVAGADDLPRPLPHLVHDRDRHVLEFRDPTGEVVGAPYLGLVPAFLTAGAQRLLLALADPWRLPPGFDAQPMPGTPAPAAPVRQPRLQRGRVVLCRAGWTVPAGQLPLPVAGEGAADLVARADAWRRELGLPPEVFCREAPSAASPLRSKPLWVDLRSAVSLGVLQQSLSPAAAAVRVEEALPARSRHPLRDRDGRRRAAEFLVTVRWPRDG